MRLSKQKDVVQVKNLDTLFTANHPTRQRHGRLLPNSIRCIISGSSGSGKTNVMLSLLMDKNGLRFDNIYIHSKSLHQPKYQFLQQVLETIPQVKYFAFKESEEILDPSQACENSIFIFDDVATDKQNKIKEYFSMGRHKSVDSFYLCQTYACIPKHLIRDNANFLILFKQDDLNLRHIYDEHVGTDMSFEKFKAMCGDCWNLNLRHIYDEHVGTDMSFEKFKTMCGDCWREKYSFLVIDKESDLGNGRYRKHFDYYII
ncbi:Poxvirus A32 protein [Popillia japonica]|uniref:Poxvirus A32 protein n=1 Tax=Popillia japonica TaxID=7064 RepID=A0AAW1LA89_POPJA